MLILPKCPERVYSNCPGKLLGYPCGFYYHQNHLKPLLGLLGASLWSSVLDRQCTFKINLVTVPSYYLFFSFLFFFLSICTHKADSSHELYSFGRELNVKISSRSAPNVLQPLQGSYYTRLEQS